MEGLAGANVALCVCVCVKRFPERLLPSATICEGASRPSPGRGAYKRGPSLTFACAAFLAEVQ